MLIIPLLFGIALLITQPASATPPCDDGRMFSVPSSQDKAELREKEQLLESQFQALIKRMRKLNQPNRAAILKTLRKSQKNWAAYRKSQCRLQGFSFWSCNPDKPPHFEYGIFNCKSNLTTERINQLKYLETLFEPDDFGRK
jgi:uncharacterized protein YecT (DUF1311 family)